MSITEGGLKVVNFTNKYYSGAYASWGVVGEKFDLANPEG